MFSIDLGFLEVAFDIGVRRQCMGAFATRKHIHIHGMVKLRHPGKVCLPGVLLAF